MSRIGKLPISIPNGVTVTIENGVIKTTGSKGELEFGILPNISVVTEGDQVKVTKTADDLKTSGFYGLTRTVIANMITGVSEGFKKTLEINGIGYRAAVNGKTLTLNLGYSHPIDYPMPEGIAITVEKNLIHVSGFDKQKVGQVAAEIRSFRKPEPYKGKGVKYIEETIRRKAGKTGK